ncbi:C-X-C chemokine receptor type 6 [Dipodomys spectabilis]|uniref:C-X-C chemokine receptor type 6 n=1 Tax=Dipodomys spectabilis TaxID=105255 RepID=UPI001C54417F|nr:C-X-C chemokine receptor type 6 [Dipodomys spectabilis]
MMATTEDEYQDPGLFGPPGGGGGREAHERLAAFRRAFLPAVYLAVFACGLVGNALALAVYARSRAWRSLADLLLANLPLADLLLVSTLPFWAYAGLHEWVFGQGLCKALQGLYAASLYASMLTLTGITVDRCVVVAWATQARARAARWAAWGGGACALAWACALLLALPHAIYGRAQRLDRLVCHYQHERAATAALAAQAALGFFLPLLAMLVCYPLLLRTLCRARGLRRHKSLRIIALAVAVFVLTQTPYTLARLVQAANWELAATPGFSLGLVVAEALAYLRVGLNPVLYAFVGLKFRKNLQKLLRDMGCHPPWGAATQCRSSEDNSKTASASPHAEATSTFPL